MNHFLIVLHTALLVVTLLGSGRDGWHDASLIINSGGLALAVTRIMYAG